jgi:hypothetical protein
VRCFQGNYGDLPAPVITVLNRDILAQLSDAENANERFE